MKSNEFFWKETEKMKTKIITFESCKAQQA